MGLVTTGRGYRTPDRQEAVTNWPAQAADLASRIDADITRLETKMREAATARARKELDTDHRLADLENLSGVGAGSPDDARVEKIVRNDASKTRAALKSLFASKTVEEETTRRLAAVESFHNGREYGASLFTPALNGWRIYGAPVIAMKVAGAQGGSAVTWSGSLNRSGAPLEVRARAFTLLGSLPAAIRPKAGTEGHGVAQCEGHCTSIRVVPGGSLEIWSQQAFRVGTGSGLEFSLNWVIA